MSNDNKKLLDGLDIVALNGLIGAAQARIQKLCEDTKEDRIKEFRKSDFCKSLNAEIKELGKELASFDGTGECEFTIKLSLKLKPVKLDEFMRSGYDLFEYEVKSEVLGENLTKRQKSFIRDQVEGVVDEMCEDGLEAFFPDAMKEVRRFEKVGEKLHRKKVVELQSRSLSTYEV